MLHNEFKTRMQVLTQNKKDQFKSSLSNHKEEMDKLKKDQQQLKVDQAKKDKEDKAKLLKDVSSNNKLMKALLGA